ncbi:ParB/RepB/Spo0J family partition protein [Gemmiger sp.]
MAMKRKPGKFKVDVDIPSTESVFSAGNNSASGNLIANLAGSGRKEIAYELREIALQDIELNPDNEIFRSLDTEEDTETLANDIDRNGLLHNLVVFPRADGKATKYVLLSGERRYKALNYLQAKGDAKWNTVRNCRVITTPLTDNEKKVMLLSANLQVRGGFANEMIRRKAVAELVAGLQEAPYNLTAADAKKAIKEVTPINGRQIDKDLSIEKNLNSSLKALLDAGFLLRSEAEGFLRLNPHEQELAAAEFDALYAISCEGSGAEAIEREKQFVRKEFADALLVVGGIGNMTDARAALDAALETVRQGIETLYNTVAKIESEPKRDGIDTQAVQEIKNKAAGAKPQSKITGKLSAQTTRLEMMLNKKDPETRLAEKYTHEERRQAMKELDEMIATATKLRDMIAKVEENA